MKIPNNNEDFELNHYLKIIDYFRCKKLKREKKKIWTSQSFIELMNLLDQTKNKVLITNSIILILSLFGEIPPDTYDNRGVDIECVSQKVRKTIINEALKNEFLPN
ncbi:MAG: hypothetical protein ACXABO_04580 [Promethearchaeota archaeon]|jgi:hypothetical protein